MHPVSIRRTRVRRAAVVHAKPVKKPAPAKKAYTYRKPELYNWSKHRSPVQAKRAAEHPAPAPRKAQPASKSTSTR